MVITQTKRPRGYPAGRPRSIQNKRHCAVGQFARRERERVNREQVELAIAVEIERYRRDMSQRDLLHDANLVPVM
jgi:hypothetical protein